MKTFTHPLASRLFCLAVLVGFLGLLATLPARAGLTMELDLNRGNYQGSQYYFLGCVLNTNSTPPNVSFGDYFVVSPAWPTNGASGLFHFDTNGFNQTDGGNYSISLFDSTNFNESLIQNLTNGQWTIFVTNAIATNAYHFKVTASITSNAIPLVSVIYPPNNALNVTNQPTYLWQGPTNYDEQVLYSPISGYVLPVNQQSFSGDTLDAGLDNLTVDTYYQSSTGVVSSVPTNSAGTPLAGWVSTWHVWDFASVQFTVGSPSADFNTDLGTSNLPWATMGDTAWFTESTNTYNGATSADQSGMVTNSQASTLSVVVSGPGVLTYYWSCLASGSFICEFDVDGNYSNNISGNTAWQQDGPYAIGPGPHILSWTAYANGDTDPTEAGFLANVSFVNPSSPTPTLTITSSPANGLVPLAVQFTSPGADSLGNTITNWNWDFGDGGTSTAQSPSHIYTNSGAYSPTLTAFSTFGATPLSVMGPGTVTVTNLVLDVSFTPQSGAAPLSVQFSSPSVSSGGSTVTNWSWTFGDGGTSTAQNPLHVYTGLGNFSPALVAKSIHGSTPLAVAGLGAVTVTNTPNPNFHTLYTFSPAFGSGPNGGLAMAGNTMYGTTQFGGISGYGTVFAINAGGTGFTNLFNNFNTTFTNGIRPPGGVILSGGTLYGSTYGGGLLGGGTVFALGTNGLGFTNLANFDFNVNPNSPDEPEAPVVLFGNTLYGTTWYGGAYDHGTIYYVTTNGFAGGILHSFTTPSYTPYINNYDGVFPSAKLICQAGTLYGTAENGGNFGGGTVFSVVTNQPGTFGILHYFSTPVNGTNSDGAYSFAGLVLSGTNLYGTTFGGGVYGKGGVFVVSTNGSFFTNLYNFTGGSDGSGPHGGLTLSGNTLYGTTSAGGTYTNGTLFAIKTDGSGFTSLYSFTGGSDGSNPQADLVFSSGVLYGTAASGGSGGNGTVFSFTLGRPQLAIARSGTNVILTWSATFAGYGLQSSSQINTSAVWSAVSPLPAVVNGLNTVTNPISTSPKFYRLSQ